MRVPYGLEIIDHCADCSVTTPGFFCRFSEPVLRSLDNVSHKSTLPDERPCLSKDRVLAFILCSGTVSFSTTPREGKILILKTAEAGEVLGLSASISGMGYEMTVPVELPGPQAFSEPAAGQQRSRRASRLLSEP